MIRKWLAKIISEELDKAFERHVELADGHASALHGAITQNTTAIAQLRQTHRAACSLCGKMTHEYSVATVQGIRRVICNGCPKKGN
jgi:hypothetical protein